MVRLIEQFTKQKIDVQIVPGMEPKKKRFSEPKKLSKSHRSYSDRKRRRFPGRSNKMRFKKKPHRS